MNEIPAPSASSRDVLVDPSASAWLKSALQSALERDPVDALNDALILAEALEARLRTAFELDDPS